MKKDSKDANKLNVRNQQRFQIILKEYTDSVNNSANQYVKVVNDFQISDIYNNIYEFSRVYDDSSRISTIYEVKSSLKQEQMLKITNNYINGFNCKDFI